MKAIECTKLVLASRISILKFDISIGPYNQKEKAILAATLTALNECYATIIQAEQKWSRRNED